MRTLYTLLTISVVLLVAVAFAVRRHIRRSNKVPLSAEEAALASRLSEVSRETALSRSATPVSHHPESGPNLRSRKLII